MMRRLVLCACLVTTPGAGDAQQLRATVSEPRSQLELVQFLKSEDAFRQAGAYSAAVAILMGEGRIAGTTPDAVATALVDVAAGGGADRPRTDAVAALIQSARRDQAKPYRRPYLGAGDRLAEIYQRSSDAAIRSIAMAGLARAYEPDKALAFLAPLAERDDPDDVGGQAAAINLIAELGTERSVTFLRTLDKRGVVTNKWAAIHLAQHAKNGYRAKPDSGPPPY